LTTIVEATASIHELLEAVGNDGVIGADIETTPLASFAVPRPPLNITADGLISSKQPAWNNDAGLDPYRGEVRVLSLWNPRGGDVRVINVRHVPLSALPQELWNTRLVFHNATFAAKHLLRSGVSLQPDKLLCSMLVAGFVARGEPSKNHEGKRRPSLAVAAKELLEVDVPKEGQIADCELPEFQPQVLDSRRQPLETGEVSIVRANHRATYPARFMLVAAMNPCRCGHANDAGYTCRRGANARCAAAFRGR
jgi:hypothetical protein